MGHFYWDTLWLFVVLLFTFSIKQMLCHFVLRCLGRLAALWPLLGLAIEVITLCVIIVAYEMKRNKRVLLDDDVTAPETDDSCAKAKMAA